MSAPEVAPELSLLTSEPLTWYDRAASWLADRCSPILLKECRQALKSRQFLWTFLLLLLATLLWSFFGVSSQLATSANTSGLSMLVGYMTILTFPLFLIVPFAAFRSLASELDGETIQLLTITTMTPKQIINGKLVSSLLQMLLYLSVLVPCIAFTYLLRGVDLGEMFSFIGYQIVGSIALCSLGVMAAGLTKFTSGRWVIALGLLFLLILCTLGWTTFQGEMLGSAFFDDTDGRSFINFIFLVVATTGWVCYRAAAALISFPADDRSSKIRFALLIQHMVILGAFFGIRLARFGPITDDRQLTTLAAVFSAHYWLLMGSLICGENPGMSERVRRELPKSLLGQSFRGLLMPGPGRGYLFVLTQILGWATIFWLIGVQADYRTNQLFDFDFLIQSASFFVGNAMHAIFYLSLSWLVVSWIRGKRRLSPFAGLLTMMFVFSLVSVFTFSLHNFVTSDAASGFDSNFSVLLSGNWWWWLSWLIETSQPTGSFAVVNDEALASAAIIVSLAAGALMVVCLMRACRELVAPAAAVPERVLEELKAQRKTTAPKGESIEEIFAARKATRSQGE
jgi:ABC-type transport system involved in multi-copper enzyme maturation permease subunit